MLFMVWPSLWNCLFAGLAGFAIESKTLIVAAPEWTNRTKADGEGLYLDYFRAIFESENIIIKYVNCPVKRCNYLVESGEADVTLDLFFNEKKSLLFPKYPMSVIWGVAASLPTNEEWKGQQSIKNHNVAWMRGYNLQSFLSVPVTWTEVDSIAQGIEMLEKKRVEFYIDEENAVRNFIKDAVGRESKLRVNSLYTISLYPGFSKKGNGTNFLEIYEKNVPKMYENGTAKKIFSKWDLEKIFQALSKVIP